MAQSRTSERLRPGAHAPAPSAGGRTERLGEAIGGRGLKASRALHRRVLASGEAGRRVADVLHGTWLGHPLHPVLTDVTIGAFSYGAAFDLVGTVTGDRRLQWAGDRLTEIGTISTVPTALAGMSDFSTVPKKAAANATLHALLNTAALGLYVASLVDRRRGRRKRGVTLSTAALGINLLSAWLGGHMVYRDRVGVNHADEFDGPGRWQALCALVDLPQRKARRFEIDGKGVLLFRDGSEVLAVGSVCSHAGGPLEEGEVEGCLVQCPWHDSQFDLRDGSVVHGPATAPLAAFDTRVNAGQVEVRLRYG